MSYNAMSVVRPRPYVISDNYKSPKRNEEENESYESSQSSRSSQMPEEQYHIEQNNTNKSIQEEYANAKALQDKAIASRDLNLKNASINIAQIIKDFRSTGKAIGASPELEEEAEAYLALIEKQIQKGNPDIKLIRSNFKNASSLFDTYITETLQRPSKVVENWIDAIFLQQINYKYNEEEVNPHFLVKFPGHKDEEQNEEDSSEDEQEENKESPEEEQNSKKVHVPKDEKLKSLFIQGKKYSYANNSKKAMESFKAALDRAIEVEDKDTESKVLFEIGQIYDKNDYLVQALSTYNRSLKTAEDLNVKTKAHYSMAQIYDDVSQFEPAINHYMSSISYAGESENMAAQSTSLTKIGSIFVDKYQKKAFDFLLEADVLSSQTNNHKVKGYVKSNIADAYDKFDEPKSALDYYSNAVKEYEEAQSPVKVAINYQKAADIMLDYNSLKAKSLLKKALNKARQTDNVQLMKEIHETLSTF